MRQKLQQKKKEVEELKNILKQDVYIGILDLKGLPSAQFQSLRNKLKDKLKIRVSKKSLIKLAIDQVKNEKENIEKLENYLKEAMPAILTTKEDPFKLARLIQQNKSTLPAKPGQIAPKDIVIPEGPTNFSPGPIIGELGAAGIKAAIENGKVVIKQETTIVKQGEEITPKQAELLTKFGIQPMEIGLNLLAIYKDSEILEKEVLFVDEKEYIEKIQTAVKEALNLAVYISYPTKETIEILLQKAEREKLALESKLDLKEPEQKPEEKQAKEQKPSEPQEHKETTEPQQTSETPKETESPQNQENKPESTQNPTNEAETKELKNPIEYSEEDSKKAQELINALKDNANGG
jgi:large subunit ribosomal protein L10